MTTSQLFLWAVPEANKRAGTLRVLNELVPLAVSLTTPYGDFALVRDDQDASFFYWRSEESLGFQAERPTTIEVHGETWSVEHISVSRGDGRCLATLTGRDSGRTPPKTAVDEFRRALDASWTALDPHGHIALGMEAAGNVEKIDDDRLCVAELAWITASTMPSGPEQDVAFVLAQGWTGDAEGLLTAAQGVASGTQR